MADPKALFDGAFELITLNHGGVEWPWRSLLDDGGLYGTPVDREQLAVGHLFLITLGRMRMDSRGRRRSLDSPNTQLNGPMMDASASTWIVISRTAGPGFESLVAHSKCPWTV
jgi:hypothetical protein